MVESIRADADTQARQIVDSANAVAREEANRIEDAARNAREEILAKARDKAKRLREREISLANGEARRIVLTIREQSVNMVCDRIRVALNTIRTDNDAYQRSLTLLLKEAIAAIGNSAIRVTLSEQDRGIAQGALRELPETSSEGIDFAFTSEHDGGGCIAESHDGRVVFDNTYARRLALAMRSLRARLIEEVVKHHE